MWLFVCLFFVFFFNCCESKVINSMKYKRIVLQDSTMGRLIFNVLFYFCVCLYKHELIDPLTLHLRAQKDTPNSKDPGHSHCLHHLSLLFVSAFFICSSPLSSSTKWEPEWGEVGIGGDCVEHRVRDLGRTIEQQRESQESTVYSPVYK